MKKNLSELPLAAALLSALILWSLTKSEVTTIRTQVDSQNVSLIQLRTAPPAVPSSETIFPRPLSSFQLFSVVGADTCDGAQGGSRDYCQQAYNQCISNCRSMAAGWAFLSGFGGQFARNYLTAWGGGCWAGCEIGFSNCG